MITDLVTITGDFDGGNPKNGSEIVQVADDAFIIRPFSEDGDPNYKFRLEIEATNHSKQAQRIRLIVDWVEPTYQSLRDYLFLLGPSDPQWLYLPCKVDSTRTVCSLTLHPGKTYLSLQPKYSYRDYLNLIHDIPPGNLAEKELIGRTSSGREIWCVRFCQTGVRPRKKLMAVCRVHPYETGGSYCAHGLVELFKKPLTETAQMILDVFDLYLVPMANPDGVYAGLCKLTSPSGINLSRQIDPSDKTCQVIKNAIDRIEPDMYVEFHNWMFKYVDGICYWNFFQCRKFTGRMPSQERFLKRWRPLLRRGFLPHPPVGYKKYARERFNASVVCFEFPWFKRSTSDMKGLGIETIKTISLLK